MVWLSPKPSIIETSHPKEDNNDLKTLTTTTSLEVTTHIKYFYLYELKILLIGHMIVFVLY